jgi:hypothetical protein
MPIEFRTAEQAGQSGALLDRLKVAVRDGTIDTGELDVSVQRIVRMKLRDGIMPMATEPRRPDAAMIGSQAHRAIEQAIARQSITVIRNQAGTLPLRAPGRRIHILTPWNEQGEAMRMRFAELGYLAVSGARLDADTWESQASPAALAPVERNGNLTPLTPLTQSRVALSPSAAAAPPPEPIDRTGQTLVHAVDSPSSLADGNTARVDRLYPLESVAAASASRSRARPWHTLAYGRRPSFTSRCAPLTTWSVSTTSRMPRSPPIRIAALPTVFAARRCRRSSMCWQEASRQWAGS